MWGWGQNIYGGHQIGWISTIFSCNYTHFQQEAKCDVERCGPKVQLESPICILGSEPTHSQVDSHFGSWNPYGVSNLLWGISGAKIHWIKNFLIPLKHSWNLDVSNGLAWPIWIFKTRYGQKKGQESKCQFDSYQLKVRSHLITSAFRWHATYPWKFLNKGYNFTWDLTSIGGVHKQLWPSKVLGVPISGISELDSQVGSPETKWHLDVTHVANHKEHY
jgi:hypothetical protein